MMEICAGLHVDSTGIMALAAIGELFVLKQTDPKTRKPIPSPLEPASRGIPDSPGDSAHGMACDLQINADSGYSSALSAIRKGV